MESGTGTDQLFLLSRTGTGHVLKFDMSFGILSKKPDTDTWNSLVNLKEFSCVSYRQFIYVLGGYSVKLKRPIQNVKKYDIITSEWTDLTSMENERRMATAVVFNDEIIICGGFKNSSKLHSSTEIYNIANNKWRKGPSFKIGISDIQLLVVNDSIMGFGGMKNSIYKNETILCSNDEIYEYKDHYNEWSILDENVPFILSKPVYNHSVVEMESKVYIIGGLKTVIHSNEEINEIVNTQVESLCIDENQMKILTKNHIKDWVSPWDRSLPSPNIPRYGAAAISLGSDIYLFGGLSDNQSNCIYEVEKFNPKRARWNIEFTIKHEIDLSLVSALCVYGSRYKSKRSTNAESVVPNENVEPVVEMTTEPVSLQKRMYKVGWVLW